MTGMKVFFVIAVVEYC